jgi:hypothetical protein
MIIENNKSFNDYIEKMKPIIEEGYYQLCICDRHIPSLKEAQALNYGKNIIGLKSYSLDEFYIRPIYGKYKEGEMEELITEIKLPCISEIQIIESKDYKGNIQYDYSSPCYTYAKKVSREEVIHFLQLLEINEKEAKKCYVSPLSSYLNDIKQKYDSIAPITPEEQKETTIQGLLERIRRH